MHREPTHLDSDPGDVSEYGWLHHRSRRSSTVHGRSGIHFGPTHMKPLFLIADDSIPKTYFLKSLIKKADFPADILYATSTEEAKKVIDENPSIAFGFIDYEMPSENGPSVIKYLKEKNPA